MKSRQYRHLPTGQIVTQVPLSRFGEYEEVVEVEGILPGQAHRILCEVSGGVSGYRSGYLKKNGEVMIFPSEQAADEEADALDIIMNGRSGATFRYTPEAA